MYKANKENLKEIKKIPQYFSEFDLFLYSFFFNFCVTCSLFSYFKFCKTRFSLLADMYEI